MMNNQFAKDDFKKIDEGDDLGLGVQEAGKAVIEKVGKLGGDGALIALDKNGNIAMPFNTEGMYRGAVTSEGKIEIYIYKD